MEKKTTVAKENHNRENQHFSETWFRDGARLRAPTKIPCSIVGKKQKDGRDEVSRILKRKKIVFWIKYWTIGVGVWLALSYLVMVFILSSP
jgi:hypothetical protein